MAQRRIRTLVIRHATTLRALRTPLRQSLLAAIGRLGTASVKEIAAEMGREPASLYYHVHALARAGLVRAGGTRPAGRRKEAVYEPAAERIVVDRKGRSPAFGSALESLNRATLGACERELAAATKTGPRGAARGARATLVRVTARLRHADAREARRRLRALARFVEQRNDPRAGGAYALTVAFVSLPRRGRPRGAP